MARPPAMTAASSCEGANGRVTQKHGSVPELGPGHSTGSTPGPVHPRC